MNFPEEQLRCQLYGGLFKVAVDLRNLDTAAQPEGTRKRPWFSPAMVLPCITSWHLSLLHQRQVVPFDVTTPEPDHCDAVSPSQTKGPATAEQQRMPAPHVAGTTPFAGQPGEQCRW